MGATLYTLLTGEAPFGAGNAGEVLARILSEPPTPFSEHGVDLPHGLDAVVMRCLKKDPAKRYQNYAALRQALHPYSTDASTVGGVLRRVVAYAIDSVLLTGAVFAIAILGAPIVMTWSWFNLLPSALYFFLTEWRWGAGVGKYLLGLRVTSRDGTPAGALPILVRTVTWLLLWGGASAIWLWLRGIPQLPGTESGEALAVNAVGLVLIVSTMRARNGYAGLHDVVSGTRVRALRRRTRLAVPQLMLPVTGPADVQRLGPFAVRGEVWRRDGEALLVGFDESLQRDVWIHTRPAGAVAPPAEHRARSRPGKLRWLQGAVDGELRWDLLATHFEDDGGAAAGTSADGAAALERFRHDLAALIERRATVTSGWRAAIFGTMIAPYLAMLAFASLALLLVWTTMPESFFLADGYAEMLEQADAQLADAEPAADERAALEERREALRRVVAFYWSDARQAPVLKGQVDVEVSSDALDRMESALRDHPDVTQGEVDAIVERYGFEPQMEFDLTAQNVTRAGLQAMTFGLILYFGVASVFAPVFAFALRGSLLFLGFGFRLQTLDGERASRARCALRALVAWTPFLVLGPLGLLIDLPVIVQLVGVAVAGAAVLYGLRNPERGIPDEIVGTQLVAR